MGQRLNIQFEDNTGVLANAYYHWSGYTGSALALTNHILASDLLNDTSISNKVKAVRLLESTGAGLIQDEFNDEFTQANFKLATNRNSGLIAISEKGMEGTMNWEEARVTLNLDTKQIALAIYWEPNADDYDPEDLANQATYTYTSELNYETVSFDDFSELYSEYEQNSNLGNYIVVTPESKLHFIE